MIMKNIKDYLPYYLGCDCWLHNDPENPRTILMVTKTMVCVDTETGRKGETIPIWVKSSSVKPILRQLSDMTQDEAQHLAWMCMDNKHLKDESYRIDEQEIQVEVVPNDNGCFLDDDVELYISIGYSCWTGYLAIRKDGSFYLCEQDSKKLQPIADMAEKITYLLSLHFDLFNLIKDGLAIDKTTLP